LARLGGGYLVDLLGRYRTVLFSALTTAAGMLIFMTSQATGLEYLGLILWGLGMALGFPMVVASMGDDANLAAPRVNMIITVVYISSISVGPALGALGQAAGIYVAFGIPLVMMIISALLSRVTKPASVK
jgi:MFS family permease